MVDSFYFACISLSTFLFNKRERFISIYTTIKSVVMGIRIETLNQINDMTCYLPQEDLMDALLPSSQGDLIELVEKILHTLENQL